MTLSPLKIVLLLNTRFIRYDNYFITDILIIIIIVIIIIIIIIILLSKSSRGV